MNRHLSRVLGVFVLITIIATVVGCGGPSPQEKALEQTGLVVPERGFPEAAAQAAFEVWARNQSTPYQNVRYKIVSNDGTFATVRVVGELRKRSEDNWLEQQADVDCRRVGDEWQCDQWFSFELSIAQLETIATARAVMAVRATATFEAVLAKRPREIAIGGYAQAYHESDDPLDNDHSAYMRDLEYGGTVRVPEGEVVFIVEGPYENKYGKGHEWWRVRLLKGLELDARSDHLQPVAVEEAQKAGW